MIGRLLASIALLAGAGCGLAPPPAGSWLPEPIAAADFALHDQHGRPFRLADRRGQAVLLFFGFVHCPDVCPMTLSTWARARRGLGRAAEDVTFVFVTVDPERDTPERLAEHLAIFDESFVGLHGTPEELDPVYRAYGIAHDKVRLSTSEAGYVINHTTRAFGIDREGRLRVTFGFDTPAPDVERIVRRLRR